MTNPPQTGDIRHLTPSFPSSIFQAALSNYLGELTMTMKIQDDCIACGACVPDCPTESISEGDGVLYVIDQATCVECVGHFDSPRCVDACPVDCIVKA
jgi:ferredoxin